MTGRLLMVGLSHHAAPLDVRERVAIDEAAWRSVAPTDLSTVLLSTCNRVEVYAWIHGPTRPAVSSLRRAFARASGIEVAELKPLVTTRVGRDAALHLIRVSSGLDSLVVGEEQITTQVRAALRSAEAHQKPPPALRGTFQRVIESARRIRGSTRLGQTPSIASAGIKVARRALPIDLKGQLAVVLGAGVMARAATESLLACGARVRVLNRTAEHAERLLAHVRSAIEIDSLNSLPNALIEAALVVGATASREPVVSAATVHRALPDRHARPLVLLDIAMPRDFDPRVRAFEGVTLIDLDDLERLCPVDASIRSAERDQAERLALEETDRVEEWLRHRAVSPAIAELRTYAESIRMRELRRSAGRLRDLTPEQAAAVEALTTGIVNKLMHGPTVALRDAALRPRGLGRTQSRILRVVRPRSGRSA